MTPEELAELLFKSLLSADAGLMNVVARNAVDRYAGMEPGRPVGGTYYLYRTLRNLDLDAVLERLMAPGPGRGGRGRADRAGGAPGGRRVQGPHRQVPPGRRDRDPPAAGRGPRRRGPGALGAQAAARGHRRHARHPRGAGHAPPGPAPALAQAGGPPGPQAAARPQGTARLPGHHAALALDRRGAHRAALPASPAGQARDLRDRRHLGLGGQLRPLHPAPGLRHQLAVLQGAQLRLRRRDRRGHAVLRGRGRPGRGGGPHQHRGRRHLGRRPLRLRARADRVPPALGRPGDLALERHGARATPATTTTPRSRG